MTLLPRGQAGDPVCLRRSSQPFLDFAGIGVEEESSRAARRLVIVRATEQAFGREVRRAVVAEWVPLDQAIPAEQHVFQDGGLVESHFEEVVGEVQASLRGNYARFRVPLRIKGHC
jgi:hypothetical protein